jgi:hypothetical protein
MKAYDSALSFISALASTNEANQALLYLPYYHFRCLLTAACILIKVLRSSYAQDFDDLEKGRTVFNNSILAITRSSVSNNDTALKAAQMLSKLWHHPTVTNETPPVLTVQSRFGAR